LKCPYCDFNSYVVSKIPEEEYCKALISEYQLLINTYDWPKQLNSIYFGGGTPSIFKAESIDYLIQNFSSHIDSNIEITIEINPGDINLEKLKQYKKSGINRLSFGTQSFNSQKLKTLGRTHTAEDAFRAVADGREAGFNNINLDLIFITPNETLEVLEETFKDYQGALVLVTHDRYIIEQSTNIILGLTPNGGAVYADYSQWEEDYKEQLNNSTKNKNNKESKKDTSTNKTNKKLGYLEQRELSTIESKIEKAESILLELQNKTTEESIVSNPTELAKICEELIKQQTVIDKLYERWHELEEKK
jgi:radical SAM superfamily enzyme YgiQ (UPF0313 family)